MKVYLAGSVPKGDEEAKIFTDWRKSYAIALQSYFPQVELFDPQIFMILEADPIGVTGADSWHIATSDLVVINAQERLGAGTAMEFVIAKYFTKPVITILPQNSYHRRPRVPFNGTIVEDWIHPFIVTFSDVIIPDITLLDSAFDQLANRRIKHISIIDDAMKQAKKLLKEKGIMV